MKLGTFFVTVCFILFSSVIPGWAGSFAGIEPSKSTKEDVESILGASLAAMPGGERFDYDGIGYQAKVISIKYSPEDLVVESIDIYPIQETFKEQYQRWFSLLTPASTRQDEQGNLVEHYFPQAVALHYLGSADTDPVEYFSHILPGKKAIEEQEKVVEIEMEVAKMTEDESFTPLIEPSAELGIVILEDNFDSENKGRGTLNYSGFVNWDVIKGTVDLIGHGFWDFFPSYGLYVDLDGSTRNAGTLQSKTIFRLEPGKYRLEFDLAGNLKSTLPDKVTVNLGNVYREDFTLDKNELFRSITRTILISTPTSVKLVFEHAGGDNLGLMLDNVKLIQISVKELPSTELSLSKVLKEEAVDSLGEGILDLSQANEAWAREWRVLSTAENFWGGKPGFYAEAVRSGNANPNPGREGILYLHPLNQKEPARIARSVTLVGYQPTLKMGVSGNRHVDGDWALLVKVNGQPLEDKIIIAGTDGWQDLTFDLSAFSGQSVTIEIEVGANNWWYEYAFFDYITLSQEEIQADSKAAKPLSQKELYKDVFRLATGEIISGELLKFDGNTFTIKTKKGIIEKRKEEILGIWIEVAQ